jgi:hypothetical protein
MRATFRTMYVRGIRTKLLNAILLKAKKKRTKLSFFITGKRVSFCPDEFLLQFPISNRHCIQLPTSDLIAEKATVSLCVKLG